MRGDWLGMLKDICGELGGRSKRPPEGMATGMAMGRDDGIEMGMDGVVVFDALRATSATR